MPNTDRKEKSIRIFKNPILESFTHVHPVLPLLMWGPFVIYLIYLSIHKHSLGVGELILWAFIGLLFWTLFEYALHRFLFHFPAKSKFTKRLVFIFHGLHHDDPNDATRLVMPPVPAILIVSVLYIIFSLILPDRYLYPFLAFFMTGYLCYDYIHYGTHHFPMKNKVARYLKKFHLQHHYSKEEAKYGVSSPLWDYVFNTVRGPKKEHK